MNDIAVAIVCKAPEAGRSKTRLSPPLAADECAALSACFIRDLAATVGELRRGGDVTGYALYTPRGSEEALRSLLPDDFKLVAQVEGDFGERLKHGSMDLLQWHRGVMLVNSDSPTLPRPILRAAVDALKAGDEVVLSPAADGGYTLIGLAHCHARLFDDMPWSTPAVCQMTVERARDLGLPVTLVNGWYDVDDAASLRLLQDELAGRRPAFADFEGAEAPATRAFLQERAASWQDGA